MNVGRLGGFYTPFAPFLNELYQKITGVRLFVVTEDHTYQALYPDNASALSLRAVFPGSPLPSNPSSRPGICVADLCICGMKQSGF